MEPKWHKFGYRVVVQQSGADPLGQPDIFKLSVRYNDVTGDKLYEISLVPLTSRLEMARKAVLLQAVCRFLNAGGMFSEIFDMYEDLFDIKLKEVPERCTPIDMAHDSNCEMIYELDDGTHIFVAEDNFWEKCDANGEPVACQ